MAGAALWGPAISVRGYGGLLWRARIRCSWQPDFFKAGWRTTADCTRGYLREVTVMPPLIGGTGFGSGEPASSARFRLIGLYLPEVPLESLSVRRA